MEPKQPELSYQSAAVQSAGPIGLVILLYDRLVTDLNSASQAIRKNDIEGRCKAANHAFQVLQHLEGSLDMVNGGETARALLPDLRPHPRQAAGSANEAQPGDPGAAN